MEKESLNRKENVLTVTRVNEYIKMLIEGDPLLSNVYIKGEISNFTNHKSGHFYFTLKDEGGSLRAVMFRYAAAKLKFMPENGMKVIARGRISAFVRDGQYQLYAEDIQPDGVGSFYFAFEQLKKKLESEGLFSQSKKRALPKIPTRIGIITSPTGAAVQDMINILNRRFPYAKVLLYPSLVQGAQAAQQLISALNYFNQSGSADLIIIGRGGGSIEDLWAFNDEALARTISASQIPVISAVGHETDFTICDFAADLRAPTPSAAAEIAVPETEELKRKINNIIGRTELLLSQSIAHKKQALTLLSSQGSLNKPQRLIDDWRMLVLSLQDNIMRKTELANLNRRSVLSNAAAKLDALSPLAILARGYAVALDSEGTLLRKKSDTKVGARINIRVSDGQILSEVIDIN